MSADTSPLQDGTIDALGSSGDAFIGMAMFGKTAAALALVIAMILLCTALLKRWQNARPHQGAHLRVITSTAVGNRERVVVVELEDTWLVLGVGSGRVTKLHERPAPDDRPAAPPRSDSLPFAQRLSQALANRRRKSSDNDPHQTP